MANPEGKGDILIPILVLLGSAVAVLIASAITMSTIL
jgi:hypothetical protein